jgi:hypothetical protein
VGYICCGSKQQEVVHPPSVDDLQLIDRIDHVPPLADGFYPTVELPEGVNLSQPRRHGLDRTDKLYTPRNLAALSHLWRAIHRVADDQTAAQLAFTFTSLYRRVTRLSEFRFWGGSSNVARLNVPYIFDEVNVFQAFERKAKTIADHLRTTATNYRGQTVVINGSATDLAALPDESVDLIFTDPPFGANIHYSEMNLLWEAWLGCRTDPTQEAIINRVQGKDVEAYGRLMAASMRECYRALRRGSWMLIAFMNSSAAVWRALRASIVDAGFLIARANIFDKRHGTLKQFTSDNTAGADLILQCLKPRVPQGSPGPRSVLSLDAFLASIDPVAYRHEFEHVSRPAELDYRSMYSEWIGLCMVYDEDALDFRTFRRLAAERLEDGRR